MASSSVLYPPAYHSSSNGGHSVYKISNLLERRGALVLKIEQPIYQSCRMEHIAEDVVIMGFCKMGIDPRGLQKKLGVADLIRW